MLKFHQFKGRSKSTYRVTHKEGDFRDDCWKFIVSATVKLCLSLPNDLISHFMTLSEPNDLINLGYSYIQSFKSSLQSYPLWVSLYIKK